MQKPSIRLAVAGAATAAVLAEGLAFAASAQAVEPGGVLDATTARSAPNSILMADAQSPGWRDEGHYFDYDSCNAASKVWDGYLVDCNYTPDGSWTPWILWVWR